MPLWLGLLLVSLGLSGPAELRLRATAVGIDFGTVSLNSQQDQIVWLENSTPRAMCLVEVDADCICLTSNLPETIPARTCVPWRVNLRTCDFIGEAHRSIWVRTEDKSEVRLPVRYRVAPPIFTEPEFVSFGLIGEEAGTAEVTLHTLDPEPVRILAARSLDDVIEVEIVDPGIRGA